MLAFVMFLHAPRRPGVCAFHCTALGHLPGPSGVTARRTAAPSSHPPRLAGVAAQTAPGAWRGLGCHPRLFLGCRVDRDGWDGRVGGLGHVSRGRPAAAATVSAPLLPAISPTSPSASPSPAVV